MDDHASPGSEAVSLGEHLAALRSAHGFSLRHVEEVSGKVVSNAYLSQLEKNKISKPSPNILHALAQVYRASYEDLMAKAGYFSTDSLHARAATFAVGDVSPDEQHALLEYLAFLRKSKRSKP